MLSDTTDLHALMGAILGNKIVAPDSVSGAAVVRADVEPAVAALPEHGAGACPPPARYPDESVVSAAVPDDHVDPWDFATEAPPSAREIASETDFVRQPGPDLGVSAAPSRDLLRGSMWKQWTIVAGLLAAGLITVSAISLRGEPTQTTRRSFEALGRMRSRPPVQRSNTAQARVFSEGEIRLPASKSDAVRVIAAPGANKRPNPATDDQTAPISVERRDVTPPLTWPIVMSPDTLKGVAEASDGVSTPAQLLTGGVPEYPAALRTAGIGGSVEVRFTIASNGEVLNVRSTTGPPALRSIAEAAVRHWRYQAARVGNQPVDTQTSVYFYFDPAKIAPQ